MKAASLFLCIVVMLPLAGRAQPSWVLEHTTPIQKDSSGRFSNLSALTPYWSSSRIISLGEQTHFDGATFDAKVQLVKYLHEQLGFNVLAFESGYYECSKAGALMARQNKGVLKDAVFGVWDNKALDDLEQYILHTQITPRPLKITGFDFQFSGKLAAQYFTRDLETALKELGAGEVLSDSEWNRFESAATRQIKYSNFYKKTSPEDTALIGRVTRKIHQALEHRKATANQAARLASFWQTACANLAYDSQHRHRNRNYRDSIMAENLLRLTSGEFAGEKIICWNATSHFIFNPHLIESEVYKEFVPMGDYLHRKLGDQLFTIGFTSLQGRAGSVVKYKLKSAPANSIENALGTLDIDYGFIGFRGGVSENRINEPIETRMLGNKFIRMSLSQVVNGLFYIKEAYPPH